MPFDAAPRCQREGCNALAAGELAILLPAIGGPATPDKCIRATFKLPICAEHFLAEAKQGAGAWLSDELRRAVRAGLPPGKAPPDFARAYLALERPQ